MKLEDGKGRGYIAAVNADNQLQTESISIPHLGYYSKGKKSAYSVHLHFEQDTGSAWEGVGYIQYTGDKNLYISKAIACNEGVATDDYYGYSFYFNPTGLSGGASVTPTNINVTAAKTLNATVIHNDDGTAVSASDDGTHFMCFRVRPSDTQNIDYQDAVILGKNDILYVKGHCKTAGERLRITFLCFED